MTDVAHEAAYEVAYPVHPSYPARNAGYDLTGGAVTVSWRNAKRMVRQGYGWEPDGVFAGEAGCVHTPTGGCYDVWLPGAYPGWPEGICSCPFFAQHAVCKHLYFAVAQDAACTQQPAPAAAVLYPPL